MTPRLAVVLVLLAAAVVLPPACATGSGTAGGSPDGASTDGASPDRASPDRDAVPIWKRIERSSLLACGGCHQEVFGEWSQSLHHGAWTNQNVLTATKNFTIHECRPCHSPLPVLMQTLDRRPAYRDFNQDDGVHCLSCHGLENGVAAARTVPDAPCRPRYEPRLQKVEMCYPCHEPTHQAFAEYRRSDAAATHVRCVDCHMQPIPRDAGRAGRSHGPNGGFRKEFVERALGFGCELRDGRLKIELRNRCGHKFPGEIPSRSFLIEVTFRRADGVVAGLRQEQLRKPFKGEDRADDRLLPDEVRVLTYELPSGATDASVRLLFRPLPLMPLDQAFLLGEWSSKKPR